MTNTPPTHDPQQPQPSRILDEPATVETCTADYADNAPVRAHLDQQWANSRGGR